MNATEHYESVLKKYGLENLPSLRLLFDAGREYTARLLWDGETKLNTGEPETANNQSS